LYSGNVAMSRVLSSNKLSTVFGRAKLTTVDFLGPEFGDKVFSAAFTVIIVLTVYLSVMYFVYDFILNK